jgi:hypothetical protein
MLGFLPVGIAIWAADFVHGLHSRFGAIVVALLAFAPRIGVVDHDAIGEADLSIILSLGAIFAIAVGLRRTAFTDLAAASPLCVRDGGNSGRERDHPGVRVVRERGGHLAGPDGDNRERRPERLLPPVPVGGAGRNLGAGRGRLRGSEPDGDACTVTTLVVMLPIQIGLFALAL